MIDRYDTPGACPACGYSTPRYWWRVAATLLVGLVLGFVLGVMWAPEVTGCKPAGVGHVLR